MIIVKSRGGLGNQLFQYAFAYALGRKFNALFAIDKIDASDRLRYFTLSAATPNGRLSALLYRSKLVLHPRLYKWMITGLSRPAAGLKALPVVHADEWTPPEENLAQTADNRTYTGYFQSEKYFEAAAGEIRRLFTVRKPFRDQFRDRYAGVLNGRKTLVVHVRRNDYLTSGTDLLGGQDLTLPVAYYLNAFSRIENLPEYQVIFISDDVAFCKRVFGESPDFSYADNSEIVDFQLLMHADALIIANSTFAWWGAYLNRKPHKRVLVPRYWLGFRVQQEFPAGILDINWEIINY